MSLNQKIIIKLSLTIFLIGFILIYLIEENYELKNTKIIELNKKDINKYYKISGKIIDYSYINKSNIIFIKLKDNTSIIDVTIFNSNQSFDSNKEYEIEGRLSLYKNKLGFIAEKINTK